MDPGIPSSQPRVRVGGDIPRHGAGVTPTDRSGAGIVVERRARDICVHLALGHIEVVGSWRRGYPGGA
jgi:hypothetical protein